MSGNSKNSNKIPRHWESFTYTPFCFIPKLEVRLNRWVSSIMSQQRRKEEECSVDSGASEFVRLSFAAADLALCCSSWQVENFLIFYMRVAEHRVASLHREDPLYIDPAHFAYMVYVFFSLCLIVTAHRRSGGLPTENPSSKPQTTTISQKPSLPIKFVQ